MASITMARCMFRATGAKLGTLASGKSKTPKKTRSVYRAVHERQAKKYDERTGAGAALLAGFFGAARAE